MYQGASAQAATVHELLLATLAISASPYAAAEAAKAIATG
jgi:hypothetical protein